MRPSPGAWRRYIPLYVLFLPIVLYYLIFSYLPMAGLLISFQDFNLSKGFFESNWVGLKHFERFWNNGDFWTVLSNTVIISFLRICFAFPAPILFALLLNELQSEKFKKTVQTISYMPHFISWVVISGILFSLFSSDGAVNKLLEFMGGQKYGFLTDSELFRQFFVASAIWKELGWGAIIYLAALSGIDSELYEAAEIDGAGRWQKLISITIPSIAPVISIMFVLSFANVLSVGFDQVLVMINPSVSSVAEVIDYYVYRVGLQQVGGYSYATAVGLFKSLISLALVLLTNRIAKSIDKDGAIW